MASLKAAVEAGLSLSEIQRTLHIDYRTVRNHYPDYHPHTVGGGGEAAEIRETNRMLREFLRRGKIGNNRENGFTPHD